MHSHILWNVDDGPETMKESLALLEQAVSEGITSIIASSHSHHPRYHADYQIVRERIHYLLRKKKRIRCSGYFCGK